MKKAILKQWQYHQQEGNTRWSHRIYILSKTEHIIKQLEENFVEQHPHDNNYIELIRKELIHTFVYNNVWNKNKNGSWWKTLSNRIRQDTVISNYLFWIFYQDTLSETTIEKTIQDNIEDLYHTMSWNEFEWDNISQPSIINQSSKKQTLEEILYTVRRLKRQRKIYSQYRQKKIDLLSYLSKVLK